MEAGNMQSDTFVEELRCWSVEVQSGNLSNAQKHLDKLYQISASLGASKEFQKLAMGRWGHSMDQQVIENLRLFLGLVQAANDLQKESRTPAVVRLRPAA
jgi:hypothetical protein